MTSTPGSAIPAERLDRLLRPERLAIVGASDKSLFSRRAFAQHQRVSGARPLALVNPRSPVVHGTATVPTCADVPGGVDCVFMMTPHHLTIDALTEAAAAGARAAVVLSQGWAEEGGEGVARQAALRQHAEELGLVLLGPNHLGFANLWDGVAPCALGLDMPVEPGGFALVSQSGAVGSSMVGYAARQDVRFSFVVTTGNEVMVSVADVVDYLVDDEHTKAIGVFAETIRKPELFRAAAARAADAGKAIVVLKAGASELAARTAAAHTGALVGDDRVIDAVLHQDGVIRVRSVEDLILTGALCAGIGPVAAPGVGVLSVSGGACDLIADRGQDEGVTFPPLAADTVETLRGVLPAYAQPQNPLDVTGAAATQPDIWRTAIAAMATDPAIGIIGAVTSLPTAGEPQRAETFDAVGEAARAAGTPVVVLPQVESVQTEAVRAAKEHAGIEVVLPSVDRFAVAVGGLTQWSTWLRTRTTDGADAAPYERVELPAGAEPTLSEAAGRALLEQAGMPVVPAVLATSAAEAAEAASASEADAGPFAVKLCSAQVVHKTEVDGVELGVPADGLAAAYERMVARAERLGVALEGVLVSPMRTEGVELLVGVTTDPDWGKVLAVAVGGKLVELLDDSALRVLPVTRRDVEAMLGELKAARLLTGYRGSAPVDLDAVVDAVLGLASLASAAPEIDSIEVNPLLATPAGVEALDVLVTRRAPEADGAD